MTALKPCPYVFRGGGFSPSPVFQRPFPSHRLHPSHIEIAVNAVAVDALCCLFLTSTIPADSGGPNGSFQRRRVQAITEVRSHTKERQGIRHHDVLLDIPIILVRVRHELWSARCACCIQRQCHSGYIAGLRTRADPSEETW